MTRGLPFRSAPIRISAQRDNARWVPPPAPVCLCWSGGVIRIGAQSKGSPWDLGRSGLVWVFLRVIFKEDGVWAGGRGRYQGKCCLDRWRGPIFLGTVLGAARGPDINENGLLSRDEPNFQENAASRGDQALSSMKMRCRRGQL